VKHLPVHGRRFDHRALPIIQSIEACGEERLDRRRHFVLHLDAARLGNQRVHLLGKQRVALRCLNDAVPSAVGQTGAPTKILNELCALGLRERL
jgi:hypothetical protein